MKISIITATYNNRDTILENISSVICQTYKNIEHIIIDNNSNDGTIAKILSQDNKNIKIISQADDGLYDALNKGISYATGDIIGFLHADDMLYDNQCIEKISNTFLENGINLIYGNLVYVRRFDISKVVRVWKSSEYREEYLKKGWMPPHPTVYMQKELITRFGKFDTKYKISADYDLMIKIFTAANNKEIYVRYVDKFLVIMRIGGISNKNLFNIYKKIREDYTVIKQNNMGGFISLIYKNISKISQIRI